MSGQIPIYPLSFFCSSFHLPSDELQHGFNSQEIISRQMNSVFKELLSRQPPVQQSALAAPAVPAPSPASSASSLPQAGPSAKKVGFGLRGRALFRPVD